MRKALVLLALTACDGIADDAVIVCPLEYRPSINEPALVRTELRLSRGGDEQTAVLGSFRIIATYVDQNGDRNLTVDVFEDRFPLSRSRWVLPPGETETVPFFADGSFTGVHTENLPASGQELTWSCQSTLARP